MNLLQHAFGSKAHETAEDRTPEEIAAEEKKARIDFHRKNVRTGPKKFTSVTEGDLRRQRRRDLKAEARKANRRTRRAYRENLRRLGILRGQLGAAGLIPPVTGEWAPTDAQRARAFEWLEENFESPEAALEKYHSATSREALAKMGD